MNSVGLRLHLVPSFKCAGWFNSYTLTVEILLGQLLWKFLKKKKNKKLRTEQPHDPGRPCVGIFPKGTRAVHHRDTCASFIAALVTQSA